MDFSRFHALDTFFLTDHINHPSFLQLPCFPEFSRRYRQELFAPCEVDTRNRTIKNRGQKFTLRLLKRLASQGNVTLLCHCAEEVSECHRHVLCAVIESGRV